MGFINFLFIPAGVILLLFLCYYHKMRVAKSSYFTISFVLIVIASIVLFGFRTYSVINDYTMDSIDDYVEESTDGFQINGFHVELNVGLDNSILVKENIETNFTEEGHHGIYRFVPSWLKYTNRDGKQFSRRANVYDLQAIDEPYELDTVNGKNRIIIGDSDNVLPVGTHYYQIQYHYDMGDDNNEGYDEFIFHLYGDYWGTSIKNASLDIHFPKTIDQDSVVHFYADKNRKKDITSMVEYSIIDNTIVATVDSSYELSKSLTVDVELPDGYFEVSNYSTYGYVSFIICVVCFLIAGTSFVLWMRYGKDFKKVPVAEEFTSPDGLDAAEVGFLNKNDGGKKLAIALIIQLASKGAITIDLGNDAESFIIKKKTITNVSREINRKIKLRKLKEAPKIMFAPYIEHLDYFKQLFPKDIDEAVVTSDFAKYDNYSSYLIENGYIEVLSDSISRYSGEALNNIQKQLLKKEEDNLPKLTENERLVYDALFVDDDEVDLYSNHTFYSVFWQLLVNNEKKFSQSVYDVKADQKMFISSIGFLASVFLWGVAYCFIKDLNPVYSYVYYIALGSIYVTLFFSLVMSRKTSYGEQLLSRVQGFKKFIEQSEMNRIDSISLDHPNYFYDILPYSYVLGLSKKWVDKFKNIPNPIFSMGNFHYYDTDYIDSLSTSIYSPSSSSSNGCGGGCSSCGGGCSSCGGGGSW